MTQSLQPPPQPQGFFKLPREIRDMVYFHYFSNDGGFSFDFGSQKMTTSDGQAICLSLRLTCRRVAQETHGLALRYNAIHFYPTDMREVWQRAARFGDLYKALEATRGIFAANASGTPYIFNLPGGPVPTDQYLNAAEVLLGDFNAHQLRCVKPREKHRFSAAAVATYFLERLLSPDLRLQIRRIHLHDNRQSVVF